MEKSYLNKTFDQLNCVPGAIFYFNFVDQSKIYSYFGFYFSKLYLEIYDFKIEFLIKLFIQKKWLKTILKLNNDKYLYLQINK